MSTKQVRKLNGKVLSDAREYLMLVSQFARIAQAVEKTEGLNEKQLQFVESAKPLLLAAMPIVVEVTECVKKLEALPSTAPAYKRRAAGKKVEGLLFEAAANSHEIIRMTLEATTLFDEVVSGEELVAEEQATEEQAVAEEVSNNE